MVSQPMGGGWFVPAAGAAREMHNSTLKLSEHGACAGDNFPGAPVAPPGPPSYEEAQLSPIQKPDSYPAAGVVEERGGVGAAGGAVPKVQRSGVSPLAPLSGSQPRSGGYRKRGSDSERMATLMRSFEIEVNFVVKTPKTKINHVCLYKFLSYCCIFLLLQLLFRFCFHFFKTTLYGRNRSYLAEKTF